MGGVLERSSVPPSIGPMTDILDHVEQPDAYTCQSAAIAKVLGQGSIHQINAIRSNLNADARTRGTMAGDPSVMGAYLTPRVESYTYKHDANLQEIIDWVTQGKGYECIIHGFTTQSGHVWGIEDAEKVGQNWVFRCDDPWYEFDFPGNRFTQNSGANVGYSDLATLAYCVKAWSNWQGVDAYRKGRYQGMLGDRGAWVHFIKN